ncbi:MAG: leucine-rich repeat protein, partial [Kiritimatiellales bacterium]|nr:leucine-rich repeat protein [Kiritimatiellales bacterium]
MKSFRMFGALITGILPWAGVSPVLAGTYYTHYTNAGCQVTLTLSTNQVMAGETLAFNAAASGYRSGYTTPGPIRTIPADVLLNGEKVSTLNLPWSPYGVIPVASSITNLTLCGSHTITIQHAPALEYNTETIYSHSVYHNNPWGADWYDYYYNVYHYQTVACSDAEDFTVMPLTHLLVINNGTGSGYYTNGEVVAITATAAPSGQVFDVWTGATQYVASVTSATTTVTMPAQDITVTATYQAVPAADFMYTTNNGTITITGYTGSGDEVTIPDTINGLPVTVIGENAFSDCISLTGISLSNSIVTIGSFAFFGCSNLVSITLSEGVSSIGTAAFYGCSSLPDITIPASVSSFGYDVFGLCHNLQVITVDPLSLSYCSIDGILFDKNITVLIRCPEVKSGNYTIPDGVVQIEALAFAGTGFSSITLRSSIATIKEFVFDGSSTLTSLYFMGNAPSISA